MIEEIDGEQIDLINTRSSESPVESAKKGMARMRTYIREGVQELAYIERTLPTTDDIEDRNHMQKRRKVLTIKMRQMRKDIAGRESEAYDDWGPKSPPNLERHEEIRRQLGHEDS